MIFEGFSRKSKKLLKFLPLLEIENSWGCVPCCCLESGLLVVAIAVCVEATTKIQLPVLNAVIWLVAPLWVSHPRSGHHNCLDIDLSKLVPVQFELK